MSPATASTALSPATVSSTAPSPASAARPPLRLVPDGTEARGFALYVGLDEGTARAAGTDLAHVVQELRRVAAELVAGVETYAAVALAPEGLGGRDVDVVRRALTDPSSAAAALPVPAPARRRGVVLDLGRKRLLLDDEPAGLTYREFELLQYLVLREGRTVTRTELIEALWSAADADVPNERTIDVHIRRLRAKLAGYEDVVRTVRGSGYRFDRHADVVIRFGATPSPDRI